MQDFVEHLLYTTDTEELPIKYQTLQNIAALDASLHSFMVLQQNMLEDIQQDKNSTIK